MPGRDRYHHGDLRAALVEAAVAAASAVAKSALANVREFANGAVREQFVRLDEQLR